MTTGYFISTPRIRAASRSDSHIHEFGYGWYGYRIAVFAHCRDVHRDGAGDQLSRFIECLPRSNASRLTKYFIVALPV